MASIIFLRIATIAPSLAQLLANSGKRVIMVDCDLNPSFSANPAPNADGGIIDVLSGARSLHVALLGIPGHGRERPQFRGRTADEWRGQDRVIHISGSAASWGAKGRLQAGLLSRQQQRPSWVCLRQIGGCAGETAGTDETFSKTTSGPLPRI